MIQHGDGARTVMLPQDPMTVDWVELGCRGWDIDETGAGLYPDHGETMGCHLDLTTLDFMFSGSSAFLRRAYDDLAAAGVHGLRDHWEITTYPPTGTAVQWVTL